MLITSEDIVLTAIPLVIAPFRYWYQSQSILLKLNVRYFNTGSLKHSKDDVSKKYRVDENAQDVKVEI